METSARQFMLTTRKDRAQAFWLCYWRQTRHNLEASKEHERCMALRHGIEAQFAQALATTSVIAARVGALVSFAREKNWPLPEGAEQAAATALQLSGDRFMHSRQIEEKLAAAQE